MTEKTKTTKKETAKVDSDALIGTLVIIAGLLILGSYFYFILVNPPQGPAVSGVCAKYNLGANPEETWQNFLEAIKMGETERASCYFEENKQETIKKSLDEMKKAELLDDMTYDLSVLRKEYQNGKAAQYLFNAINGGGQLVTSPVKFSRTSRGWAISDF